VKAGIEYCTNGIEIRFLNDRDGGGIVKVWQAIVSGVNRFAEVDPENKRSEGSSEEYSGTGEELHPDGRRARYVPTRV